MKRRKQFVAPRVVQAVQVCLENDLLGDSIRFSTTVTTMGQAVEEYDLDTDDYEIDMY